MGKEILLNRGIILTSLGIILLTIIVITGIDAYYSFENNYKSYWELGDRSSTLSAKEKYITQFVDNINRDRGKFSNYNAIFLKTPQNSFDNNIKAVITLRDRLKDIEKMDETSFEYQVAIQQITAQEQGEAQEMLKDIQGSYELKSYPLIWDWIFILISFVITFSLGGGIILIMNYFVNKRKKEFY